jgi:hypothetical protein
MAAAVAITRTELDAAGLRPGDPAHHEEGVLNATEN